MKPKKVPGTPRRLHELVKIKDENDKEKRYRCCYCAAKNKKKSITRYKCNICDIPLCTSSSGTNRNCFTLAHASEDTLEILKNFRVERKGYINKDKR